MDPSDLHPVQKLVVWALPVLFAITLHEVAHGWVANKLGDPTARMLGRLTLNPFKHVDPMGTVVFPGVVLVLSMLFGGNPLIFGWAKPVPVTARNLRQPRRDMALVAIAGPGSNVIQAVLWVGLGVAVETNAAALGWVAKPLGAMAYAGVVMNIGLAALNLLPIPPLDGGRVLSNLLPPRTSARYDAIEPYGIWIVLALLFTGLLSYVVMPFYVLVLAIVRAIVGLF